MWSAINSEWECDTFKCDVHLYLEETAEVMQGALGSQEAPRQSRADLLTHGIEVGDESVRYLEEGTGLDLGQCFI